jgi:hypothetical protein
MTAACSSISVSRSALRPVIRCSVSSRIRAISAFDHSRMPATSSSAARRRSAASVADRPWIVSMWVFASPWSWPSARRAGILGGGLHRLRQVGEELVRLLRLAAGGGVAATGAGSARGGLGPGSTGAGAVGRVGGGLRGRVLGRPAGVNRLGSLLVGGSVVSFGRSELHGSRNPLFASVVAIRRVPLQVARCRGSRALPHCGGGWWV